MAFDTDSPAERREASEYESLHRRQAGPAQKRRELAERLTAVAIAEYERTLLYWSVVTAIERVLAEQEKP